MADEKQVVFERDDLGRIVSRMAHEIVEKAVRPTELVLIGIRSRGVHLARRMARKIEEIDKVTPPVAVIDVSPYRDDKSQEQPMPAVGAFEVPVVDDKTVVLVDDVIYRGRTIRAAMEAVERLGPTEANSGRGADRSRRPRVADSRRYCRQEYRCRRWPTGQRIAR